MAACPKSCLCSKYTYYFCLQLHNSNRTNKEKDYKGSNSLLLSNHINIYLNLQLIKRKRVIVSDFDSHGSKCATCPFRSLLNTDLFCFSVAGLYLPGKGNF